MGRSPCCDENGLKKGPWTPEEDDKLVQYIQKHGHGSWRALPKLAGLNRCGKSCRLRWTNYLRPDIKRGNFSQEEEQTILHLHSILGNKWSAIASHLPGRTDNEIKNFWNTHLKKLIQMGFDPMTHQPRTDLVSTLPYLLALFNNMTDLMDPHHDQLAKLQYLNSLLQSTASSLNTTNNSSFDQNGLFTTNMEAMNLLNSLANLKDSPDMNYPVMLNNNINNNNNSAGSLFSHHHGTLLAAQPLHHHQNLLLSHMSNPPQVPFTSQSCLNNSDHRDQGQITNFTMISDQGDHNNTTPDHESSSILLPTSLPPLVGDATSSSSSYGGISSSHWNELFFEDTIMHDLS